MAEITIHEWNGQKIYRLSNDTLTAYINPEDGLNVFQLCYDEMEVVSYQEERAMAGATHGIPILFPTPNRTQDSVFTFEGKSYTAKMHGIVRKAPFQVVEAKATANIARMKGIFSIDKNSTYYLEFPFVCTLSVQIELTKEGLKYQYEVENQDKKRLPFGFGLHPFFNKINDATLVCLCAQKVMLKDEESIPTGQMLDVKGTPYDLSNGKKINELALDDVYREISKKVSTILTFKDFQIVIDSSKDFSHMVVYTPQKEAFFCVEPQTCSTDAINLYERGELEASGLTVLKSGEKAVGEVMFKFIS